MITRKSSTLPFFMELVAYERALGTRIGKAWQYVWEGLAGKPVLAAGQSTHAAVSVHARQAQAAPREIFCVSEQEAVELAGRMTAQGYAAEIQYDIYDFSWSVEVSAAASKS